MKIVVIHHTILQSNSTNLNHGAEHLLGRTERTIPIVLMCTTTNNDYCIDKNYVLHS
jgi:hypothetical protein